MAEQLKTSVVETHATNALGALTAESVLLVAGPTMTRGGTMISTTVQAVVNLRDSNDGPYLFGVADKDLTAAEIEKYLALNGPVSPSDTIGAERASRGKKIRELGLIGSDGFDLISAGPTSLSLRNTKVRLAFREDTAGWNWWLRLLSPDISSGSNLRVYADSFVEFKPFG